MNSKKIAWIFTLLTVVAIGYLSQHRAAAAVELIYFDAEVLIGPAVFLEWETGSETDVAGYLIKRDDGGGPETIEIYYDNELVTLIPAEGATVGAYYSVEDEDVEDQTSYTYYLYEVTTSNAEAQIAVLTIFVDEDGDDPTPFPIRTPTPLPGTTSKPPSATATSFPSATSQAGTGATATPGAAAGGATTPTPRPTIGSQTGGVLPTSTTALSAITTQPQATVPPANIGIPVAEAQEGVGYPGPGNEFGEESQIDFSGGNIQINPIEPVVVADASIVTSNGSQNGNGSAAPALSIQVDPSTTDGARLIGQDALAAAEIAAGTTNLPTDQTQQEPESAGSWILWVSFMGAMLLFIGGVWMALILYRKRQSD